MQLHAPFVALFYHPLQRIPVRIRGFSLLSAEEFAPWFVLAWIERIALGAHLKDDGVDAISLKFVELATQSALHGGSVHALKLSVHALYPCSPELSFGRFLVHGNVACRAGRGDEDGQGHQYVTEKMFVCLYLHYF